MPEPTTVLIVDDHPALRAGLTGLIGQEPGLRALGAVASEAEMLDAMAAARPEVVILDYALEQGDGLSVCFRLKQRPDPPGVLLYSAYADAVFAVPALLAQADTIVSKTAPVGTLVAAVHAVAAREATMPPIDPEAVEAASARLRASDLPVAGMLFAGVPLGEIARTLGRPPREVRARALRIIGELQARDRNGDPPPAGWPRLAVG